MFIKRLISTFLILTLICLPLKSQGEFYYDAYDGCGYAESRRIGYLAAGIAIGVLVFTTMYIILVSDGKNGHGHH